MPVETLVVVIGFTLLGFFLGKNSSGKASASRLLLLEQKSAAYKELFAAFIEADSALLKASTEETTDQISEKTKEQAWASLNALSRVFERARFMFPQSVITAMDEAMGWHFSMPWGDVLADLRRGKENIYFIAREDVGADRYDPSA